MVFIFSLASFGQNSDIAFKKNDKQFISRYSLYFDKGGNKLSFENQIKGLKKIVFLTNKLFARLYNHISKPKASR